MVRSFEGKHILSWKRYLLRSNIFSRFWKTKTCSNRIENATVFFNTLTKEDTAHTVVLWDMRVEVQFYGGKKPYYMQYLYWTTVSNELPWKYPNTIFRWTIAISLFIYVYYCRLMRKIYKNWLISNIIQHETVVISNTRRWSFHNYTQ